MQGYIAGQLAKAGVLLRIDEFFEHHGAAAAGLQASPQHFQGEQVVGAQRKWSFSLGLAQVVQQQGALGARAAGQGHGQQRGETEDLEIVAGGKKRLQVEHEGLALFDGGRGRAFYQEAGDGNPRGQPPQRHGGGGVHPRRSGQPVASGTVD